MLSKEDGENREEEAARKMRINKKNFGRFFPKLNERSSLIKMPSMLVLSCNIIETLRLRYELLLTLQQTSVLQELYKQQTQLMRREGGVYLKESFGFPTHFHEADENLVNFIDDGPASSVKVDLAINEYDESLRSSINMSDPECFKALILPMGLEELRAVLAYEVMNLQTLIVATRTNQILLDTSQRKLVEIELLEEGITLPNPVLNTFEILQGKNLLDGNIRKVPKQERSIVNSYILN
jgi:hypothetical protein